MRRMLIALMVSVGVLVLPGSATAQLLDVGAGDLTAGVFPDEELAALESSGYPFAVGGGITSDTSKFAFSAHLGPNGPSGYAVLKRGLLAAGAEAQGHVVCYRPGGIPGVALFTIRIEKAANLGVPVTDFPFITFRVLDSAVTGSTLSDALLATQRHAPDCIDGPVSVGGGPVVRGNIVVKS
jgi:hypothetical protein